MLPFADKVTQLDEGLAARISAAMFRVAYEELSERRFWNRAEVSVVLRLTAAQLRAIGDIFLADRQPSPTDSG